jgi:hypothetical protein
MHLKAKEILMQLNIEETMPVIFEMIFVVHTWRLAMRVCDSTRFKNLKVNSLYFFICSYVLVILQPNVQTYSYYKKT